jgi:SAM-dependent methyltransferase
MSSLEDRAALHTNILRLIKEETDANPVTYNSLEAYQAYERIGFEGRRWSVEKRLNSYGCYDLLNSSQDVLDIGSNMGFFVVEFAHHCHSADGVEPNPQLNEIGEITATYTGVGKKTRFFDCRFENFEADRKYDLIFSFAAFFTADGRQRKNAEAYFGQIFELLKPGGKLFFESTSFLDNGAENVDPHKTASEEAARQIEVRGEILNDWTERLGSQGGSRRFILAKSKSSSG